MRRLLLVFAFASFASAQWQSVDSMPPGRQIPGGIEYRNASAAVRITIAAPGVFRVRMAHGRDFGPEHSWAVVSSRAGAQAAVAAPEGAHSAATFDFSSSGDTDRLHTADGTVEIGRSPFRLHFLDASGAVQDEDYRSDGMAWDGDRVRVWKVLHGEDHFFGFGEKTGPLDKRGLKLGGNSYTMWNSDVYGYTDSTDPLYVDIPFFMVLRNGHAHGIFFDNTYRSSFDIGKESTRYYDFGAEGGELNYYYIAGPAPRDVLRRYSALTGRIELPPLWSLGYQQCRYSYYPESVVRGIAEGFRSRRIPADGIWFDIHYMDGYRVFTWNAQRFPDPRRLLSDLSAMGFATVAIFDPGIKVDPGYGAYDSGVRTGIFAKLPDGRPYVGPVWPGPAAFPDFTATAGRAWWSQEISNFVGTGLNGVWNDMNEPSVFDTINGTMPDDVEFDNDGRPSSSLEDHNVYGQQMSRASRRGLLLARPDRRTFVLTRASYAGGQRYAAIWTGDNSSDWNHLRSGITTLLGLGISGFPFVGNDIGGFAGVATPDLWTRWVEAGSFFPFMRGHAELHSPPKEPWAFGKEHEAYNRAAIERRYEFLPYIYNAFYEASQTGMPMMRALMLEFPSDAATYSITDEFMFGRDLLVAPVLSPDATRRSVYWPSGQWYSADGRRTFAGGKSGDVAADESSLPLFVRDGAILFKSPVVQNTRAWATAPLIFEIFSRTHTKREYYEDDGNSYGYDRGDYFRRTIRFARNDVRATVTLGAAQGIFTPRHPQDLVIVHFADRPTAVRLNGRMISDGGLGSATRLPPAWRFEEGHHVLTIAVPQNSAEQTIEIDMK
jgi:alpha-glucosidase